MAWLWSAAGMSILWLVLHSADYLLTIAAARTYARGDLRSRIDIGGGSLELNPAFQRAVNRGAWLSRRFLVTLLGGALVLFAVFHEVEAMPGEVRDPLWFAVEAAAGVLLVTRLVVICGHLQTLALFRRMLRSPAAAAVMVRYDRGTVFAAKRWAYAQPAALCALAYLVTPRPFFAGGAVGMLLLMTATMVWQSVEPRRGGGPQQAAADPAAGTAGPGGGEA